MATDFDPTLLPDGKLAAFESKTLEYKRDLSSPERVLRALVAFANSAGGSVVIGVDDDHSVIGVSDPLVEENRLTNLVMNAIAPTLVPEIEIVLVDAKPLLAARVYPAGQRPFHIISEGAVKGVYVRLGSSNIQADKWVIADLHRQSERLRFDQLPNTKAKSGLDEEAITKAFPGRDLDSAKQVLELTVEEQGRLVPTNGGVLLFGRDREHLFPDAWVYCGRFRGADGLDLTDTLELYANLLDIPDLVEAFLKKHAFRGADMREWRRKDDWSVPLDILREAVINALIHSDYTQQGGPIRVAFYDDHVYVESLGGAAARHDGGVDARGHVPHPQPDHRPRFPRGRHDRAVGLRCPAYVSPCRRTRPRRAQVRRASWQASLHCPHSPRCHHGGRSQVVPT
jgi:ATP-dependent DNA helicase RecG